MPKYVIERNIPGVGSLSQPQLQAASQKSCAALQELGSRVQWVQSYVTADRLYCIYIAPDEAAVRRHAEISGFPASKISRVTGIIDPTKSE